MVESHSPDRAKRSGYINHPNPNYLEGLKAIAIHMDRSTGTIRRWILHHGFPATRLPNGHWFTSCGVIDTWIIAGHRAYLEDKAKRDMMKLEELTLEEVEQSLGDYDV